MKNIVFAICLFSSLNTIGQSSQNLHKKAAVVDSRGDVLSDQFHSGVDFCKNMFS